METPTTHEIERLKNRVNAVFSLGWGGDIDQVAVVIDEINESKGWNVDRDEAEWAALAHTEISEAFESYRNGEPLMFERDGKPEGAAIEYADLLIRVLHWFIRHDIEPSEALRAKMLYNCTRPFRHGGKKA